MCSYVLYKEFLPTPKKEEGRLSPHFSRVAIKDLIKEIHKSKHEIRDHPKKQMSLPSSHRNHSLSSYDHDKKGIFFRNKPKKDKICHYSTQKRPTSPNQFTDINIAHLLHSHIPQKFNSRVQNSLKILSRRHVNPHLHRESPLEIAKHRHTQLIKHHLTDNNRSRQNHSEIHNYSLLDSDKNTCTNSKSKTNILSPEQLRNLMISDRIGLKRNGIVKTSPLKSIKTSMIKVGNSQIRLSFRQETEHIPQELKSSKVIFQKKDSLRRQFLINVRKLHQINSQKIQGARRQIKVCSRHQTHGQKCVRKDRQIKGMRFRFNENRQLNQVISPRRHNTQNFKSKRELEAGAIQPW